MLDKQHQSASPYTEQALQTNISDLVAQLEQNNKHAGTKVSPDQITVTPWAYGARVIKRIPGAYAVEHFLFPPKIGSLPIWLYNDIVQCLNLQGVPGRKKPPPG